ncbi:hypothetical protein ACVXHB_09625 [Escherichia coli]
MEDLSISLSFRLIIPAFDYFFIISGSKMSSISLIPTGSRPVLLAAVLGRLFWTGTVFADVS